MNDEEGEEAVDLTLDIYPARGGESETYEVTFGPESNEFNFLVSVDGSDGSMKIIIGNGPDVGEIADVIIPLLKEVAEIIEHAEI